MQYNTNILFYNKKNVALMKIYAYIVKDLDIKPQIVTRSKISVLSRQIVQLYHKTKMPIHNRDHAVRLFHASSQSSLLFLCPTLSLLYYTTISWFKEPPNAYFIRFRGFNLFCK